MTTIHYTHNYNFDSSIVVSVGAITVSCMISSNRISITDFNDYIPYSVRCRGQCYLLTLFSSYMR